MRAPLWLSQAVLVLLGAAAGAIGTPIVVYEVRRLYINWTTPNFRWDWDFAGYAFVVPAAILGLIFGTGLGYWAATKLKDESTS